MVERLKEPLYGYVAVEFAVGCIGLFFHDIFQVVTAWAYALGSIPHLAGSWALIAAKWAIAGSLILPQSVLLGMTFPLMSAGVLRLSRSRAGTELFTALLLEQSGRSGRRAGRRFLSGGAGRPARHPARPLPC